jgi:hypothetical protein
MSHRLYQRNHKAKQHSLEKNKLSTDLKPIYGTTVDNGRELADAIPETIPNGTHSQHNV